MHLLKGEKAGVQAIKDNAIINDYKNGKFITHHAQKFK